MAARRDSVQSVERALDLLEVLSSGEALGVSELASRTGLVPSTAHRLLSTLSRRGYVTQRADSNRYAIGLRVLELASGLEDELAHLRRVARPQLEGVQRATGETANLVVLDGERAVYVDQVQGSRSVRMFTTVGATVLAHTTAAGKAILAFAPPEHIEHLYGKRDDLEQLTPRTLTTVDAFLEDLERTKRRGYAIDNEEHEEGVSCIAAPVLGPGGISQAAISISAPTPRIINAETDELGRLLREHADGASAALTGQSQDGAGLASER